MTHVLAIDQGTTSSRAIVFDERMGVVASAAGGVPAALPAVGLGRARPRRHLVLDRRRLPRRHRAGGRRPGRASPPSASPTSARRRWSGTARPASRSAAPSSGRTAAPAGSAPSCKRAGHEAMVTAKTGLLLDPYFSGTKLKWLLDAHDGARARAREGRLLFGTVDTWLIWKLTGGAVHATDATNAARTLLYNIREGRWDADICALLDIPMEMLPEVARLGGGLRRSPAPTSSARRCGSWAWPATSRRRRSGRPASPRGCSRRPTAPAASPCSTPGASRCRAATGSSPPSPTSSTASRPMRSRARSSSPARWCSGCATG